MSAAMSKRHRIAELFVWVRGQQRTTAVYTVFPVNQSSFRNAREYLPLPVLIHPSSYKEKNPTSPRPVVRPHLRLASFTHSNSFRVSLIISVYDFMCNSFALSARKILIDSCVSFGTTVCGNRRYRQRSRTRTLSALLPPTVTKKINSLSETGADNKRVRTATRLGRRVSNSYCIEFVWKMFKYLQEYASKIVGTHVPSFVPSPRMAPVQ